VVQRANPCCKTTTYCKQHAMIRTLILLRFLGIQSELQMISMYYRLSLDRYQADYVFVSMPIYLRQRLYFFHE